MKYSTTDVVAVVGRRAAYMKNPTDVVPVAAEVVARQVADLKSLTDTVAVLMLFVVAAKTSKKRRILSSSN